MTKHLLLSLVFLLSSLTIFAEEPPKEVTETFQTLITAVEDNDLEKFESVCNEEMKKAMTTESLDSVSEQLSEALLMGHKKIYMNVLDRGEIKTYYWKIDFRPEGIPDFLGELSIKEGKCAGFFLR